MLSALVPRRRCNGGDDGERSESTFEPKIASDSSPSLSSMRPRLGRSVLGAEAPDLSVLLPLSLPGRLPLLRECSRDLLLAFVFVSAWPPCVPPKLPARPLATAVVLVSSSEILPVLSSNLSSPSPWILDLLLPSCVPSSACKVRDEPTLNSVHGSRVRPLLSSALTPSSLTVILTASRLQLAILHPEVIDPRVSRAYTYLASASKTVVSEPGRLEDDKLRSLAFRVEHLVPSLRCETKCGGIATHWVFPCPLMHLRLVTETTTVPSAAGFLRVTGNNGK